MCAAHNTRPRSFSSTVMDDPSRHGSSSGAESEPATPHGPAEFLIAQQQLNAVADILATGALQDVGEDRRRDASASLSATRALLSPEQRHNCAEPVVGAVVAEAIHACSTWSWWSSPSPPPL